MKGKSTGVYRFKTALYGLTTIFAVFQRVIDAILSKNPQAHAFIDDLLVVNKGTEIEHISAVEKILRKIDKEKLSLDFIKCKIVHSVHQNNIKAQIIYRVDS